MDVFDLINGVDAEVVANKATVKVDGTRGVVAQVIGDKMVLTAEGEEMAKNAKPAPASKAKNTKSKTAKAAAAPKSSEQGVTDVCRKSHGHYQTGRGCPTGHQYSVAAYGIAELDERVLPRHYSCTS